MSSERPTALLARLVRASTLVRFALVGALGVGLVATAGVLVQALALASLLGGLFTRPHAALGAGLGWFVVGSLVRAGATSLAEPLSAAVAAPLRRDLRARLLERLVREGPGLSLDAEVRLATRGVDAVESYVGSYLPTLALALLAPLTLLVWMVATDALSALVVFISLLLLPVFMVLLGQAAKEKMHERWSDQQRYAGYFGDVVRGMSVLKSYNRSTEAVAGLVGVGEALRVTTMATLRVAFFSSFALELLASLATALVALLLGIRLLNGSIGLSLALSVLLVTPEVFLPLRRSSARFHSAGEGVGAASELLAVLESSPSMPRATLPAPERAPRLELRGVVSARGDGALSAPCSATIEAGALVQLVGASGSGKTALARVLCGLTRPYSGEVLVDGVELETINLRDWQRRVGYVPQDPSLPGSSVREALTMGDERMDDVTMLRALARVGLDIELDRALGEGSRELSAGERRRLALARALVRGPLVLVLDEPTSHLDAESARQIATLIGALDMTRVVATHQRLEGAMTILVDGRFERVD